MIKIFNRINLLIDKILLDLIFLEDSSFSFSIIKKLFNSNTLILNLEDFLFLILLVHLS